MSDQYTLEERVYYEYPGTMLKTALGVHPHHDSEGWRFTPGRTWVGEKKEIYAKSLPELHKMMREAGFTLPEGVGEITDVRRDLGKEFHKTTDECIRVRPRHYGMNHTLVQPSFRFEFRKDSISSFTSAVENAKRVREMARAGRYHFERFDCNLCREGIIEDIKSGEIK